MLLLLLLRLLRVTGSARHGNGHGCLCWFAHFATLITCTVTVLISCRLFKQCTCKDALTKGTQTLYTPIPHRAYDAVDWIQLGCTTSATYTAHTHTHIKRAHPCEDWALRWSGRTECTNESESLSENRFGMDAYALRKSFQCVCIKSHDGNGNG